MASILTILVTALIPLFIWRLSTKQADRDTELRNTQAASLLSQEQILKRQRRDSLLSIAGRISGESHLRLLWAEINEFGGSDRELLRAAIRANVALSLPGYHSGVHLADELDQAAVDDYSASLEARYADEDSFPAYAGLLDFLRLVDARGLRVDTYHIVRLVSGTTANVQRPGHSFFRELVSVLPACASGLLLQVEKIDSRTSGGLRLNVLTGVLLGLKDANLGREFAGGGAHSGRVAEFRSTVPGSLAHLLHRDNLRSFDYWSREGSTEPVSATVAWLVRAVGWLADSDDHLAMRMIQNLESAINSIPLADRQWGSDAADVLQGVQWIEAKQPELWEQYGSGIERAADAVGDWRTGQP